VYLDLSAIYLRSKDTVNALKAIGEGVAKYPTNSDLRKRQIEIALQSGKQADLLTNVQAAIANDPKNKTLYYYAGLTYSQLADEDNAKSAKEKTAAAKNALHQKALDNYAKAAEMYKKAVEIDPNYFEANLNLGYVLVRPAIDIYNAAGNLPANKQKEYDQEIARAGVQFDIAKPYLQKAVDLNPKSIDALTNLLSYYRGKRDNANAAKIQAQINTLKANNPK
jgi:tetratricopeptide (TPR) repeat protein